MSGARSAGLPGWHLETGSFRSSRVSCSSLEDRRVRPSQARDTPPRPRSAKCQKRLLAQPRWQEHPATARCLSSRSLERTRLTSRFGTRGEAGLRAERKPSRADSKRGRSSTNELRGRVNAPLRPAPGGIGPRALSGYRRQRPRSRRESTAVSQLGGPAADHCRSGSGRTRRTGSQRADCPYIRALKSARSSTSRSPVRCAQGTSPSR